MKQESRLTSLPFYLNGIVLLAGTLVVWVLLRGKSNQALPKPIGQLQ
jgi:hypothetical protein